MEVPLADFSVDNLNELTREEQQSIHSMLLMEAATAKSEGHAATYLKAYMSLRLIEKSLSLSDDEVKLWRRRSARRLACGLTQFVKGAPKNGRGQ